MSPNYPCRIDWARLFACSMLLRGSVMKKRLSFFIIGHCFLPFKVITDQAFQWLNYNRKENIACMLKIKRALKKIMSKSYISITGKFLWPFRNLMQFPENSCKSCKPNFKLYMCWWKCSIVIYDIYIYTHDYIHDILIMNISCLSGIFINLKFTEEETIKKMFHAYWK